MKSYKPKSAKHNTSFPKIESLQIRSPDKQDNTKTHPDSNQYFSTLTKPEKCKINVEHFPFKRSEHYYHLLLNYPRLQNTTYVLNLNPFGTFHDHQLYLQHQTKDLINRKYITLPLHQKSQKSKDKNICHQYIFKNEDKKWRIDQLLYELKYIRRHEQILFNNTAKNFSMVKRDMQLSILYDFNVEIDDKKSTLNRKIQFLQSRKLKLYQQFQQEDQLFYKISLDQQFFNKKQQQDIAFNIQNIMTEAICMSEFNDLMERQIDDDSVQYNKLMVLFSIFTTLDKQSPVLNAAFEEYMKNGKKRQQIIPSFMLLFNDKKSLDWIGQALLMRSYQLHGETGFYELKKIWKKIFSEDIVLLKEYVNIQSEEYAQAIRVACSKLNRNCQLKLTVNQKIFCLPKPTKHKFYFHQSKQVCQLSMKQYIILYLIYYLYERVNILNIDYSLVGSDLFQKYQYQIISKIGQLSVSSFQLVLKRCIDLLIENVIDSQIPIQIYFENANNNNLVMVWTKKKQQPQSQEELKEKPKKQHNLLSCDQNPYFEQVNEQNSRGSRNKNKNKNKKL